MPLLILRMGRRIKRFRRVARSLAASGRVSDETRACRDYRDEVAALPTVKRPDRSGTGQNSRRPNGKRPIGKSAGVAGRSRSSAPPRFHPMPSKYELSPARQAGQETSQGEGTAAGCVFLNSSPPPGVARGYAEASERGEGRKGRAPVCEPGVRPPGPRSPDPLDNSLRCGWPLITRPPNFVIHAPLAIRSCGSEAS